jgi:D-3-phosphoglycerate dehydrogenase / 2-oxoglutarate reductase
MTYNVVVAAPLSADGLALLRQADDIHVTLVEQTPEALAAHLSEAHAIIVGEELLVTDEVMEASPNLEIIARAGSSLTNVDINEATRRGIIVMNTPGVDAISVAEYTFAMLLALVRGVVEAHLSLQNGSWQKPEPNGIELKGKTLGIIGYGRVGLEIASRAMAFGMDVLVSDPYVSESQIAGQRIKLVGLDDLFSRAHVITLHSSIVSDTENFINAEALAHMRRGVYLVNIKHSGFIDETALLNALDDEHVEGVALDDFDPDLQKSSPLIGHPKVLHSQRRRSNTYEAHRDLSTLLVPQILDALRQQDYRNAVNLPFMPGREYEVIGPQMRLGEKIGQIQHYLGHRAAIERVEISVSGEEMEGLLKPFIVAILYGLLLPRLGKTVNYINAPIQAAEMGILVTQKRGIALDTYPNLVASRVIWEDGGELVVAGALFNRTEPRIVQIDRYRTDVLPEGSLLVLGSYDIPGVIGKVGTYMADHGINIAGWRTSRLEQGGHTLTVITIDEPLSEERMVDLRSKDFVRHATQIIFNSELG